MPSRHAGAMMAASAPAPDSLLARALNPASPRPFRLAAARGALPLERQEMVLAFVRLQADPDPEIAGEADKSLVALPIDVLLPLLGESQTDPSILDHFARRNGTAPEALIIIVTNSSVTDDTLLHLAACRQTDVLDQIVGNEARLAKNTSIAGVLKANPLLSRNSKRRITELEQHVLGHAEISFQPSAAPEGNVQPEAAPPEEAAEAPAPALEVLLTPEELAAEEALRNTPLYQRIAQMNIAERIQVAIKGNAEERSILIRDPSRIVASTVLKSPKLNDQEVENYSKLRNVSDEVLRIIGMHQEWTKHYGVAHALARNPRTPTGVSLTMLNRLVNKDLKNMGTDKNIPEVIRRSAKRLFELRTKPPEKGKRK